MREARTRGRFGAQVIQFIAVMLAAAAVGSATAAGPIFKADAALAQMDAEIDWSRFRLLAVQHAGRYKAFASYSREMMASMVGEEHLPGLTPYASSLEWIFNSNAYADVQMIRVKDVGIRMHLSAHMNAVDRHRIRETGYMTPREFLTDPTVQQRINELMGQGRLRAAMGRVATALESATQMDELTRIFPRPDADLNKPWFSAIELAKFYQAAESASPATLDAVESMRQAGLNLENATELIGPWASLRSSWLNRDAAGVQSAIDRLAAVLPGFAGEAGYPHVSQLAAEARYYSMGKFAFGWVTYFIGLIAAIWALVTGWRTPRWIALGLLLAGLGLHAYGLGLRWYILDRIPVANMFEAVVASAWIGIVIVLLLELVHRTGVFMVAAHAAGFMALIMASYVIPGGGTISNIQMILDDVMLRIHTTLIIASYALIFIGGVIAVCYLFGYYFTLYAEQSTEMGIVAGFAGAALLLVSMSIFKQTEGVVDNAAGYIKASQSVPFAWGISITAVIGTLVLWKYRAPSTLIGAGVMLLVSSACVALGARDFVYYTGTTMFVGGFLWASATALGNLRRWRAGVPASVDPMGVLATPMGTFRGADLLMEKPIMAGGAPGDEGKAARLPRWLHDFDWSHLIILNLVFVMLFVGIVLGAMWADYSWGRPWGWDPKEVFALNTWIIYAILIHTRFLVKSKGLWTAWMSVGGCLMMTFNWVYVNFFLVGLHSYA